MLSIHHIPHNFTITVFPENISPQSSKDLHTFLTLHTVIVHKVKYVHNSLQDWGHSSKWVYQCRKAPSKKTLIKQNVQGEMAEATKQI